MIEALPRLDACGAKGEAADPAGLGRPDDLTGGAARDRQRGAVEVTPPQGSELTAASAAGSSAPSPSRPWPGPGRAPTVTQSRATAITPDGATVFLTSGGEGRITAIDPTTRRVQHSITAPTKLSGAYVTVVRLGQSVHDLIAR